MRTFVIALLLLTVPLFSISVPAARAAAISTETILGLQKQSFQDDLQRILTRDEVRKELVDLGVDPEYADRRIAAMTDSELAQVRLYIDQLPAGGSSALAVLGAVFLVLLVLELVGVTNVFSKL